MPETLAPAARHACLTMLVAQSFEAQVVDWLVTDLEIPTEFSVHEVAVRGPGVRLTSAAEKVAGLARRSEIRLMVECERLETLVTALGTLPDGVVGAYWIVPVTRCGTLGGVK